MDISSKFSADLFSKILTILILWPCPNATWGHAKLQVHSRSRSTGTCCFFSHAKHVNQHCIYLDRTFAIYFFFHISAASDMSVLEKMLEEIARLTNFSPDQVCLYDSSNVFWFHFI